MMTAILQRLREPSTWAGLAALLGAFGLPVAPEVLAPAVQVVTGAAALAAVFLGERK